MINSRRVLRTIISILGVSSTVCVLAAARIGWDETGIEALYERTASVCPVLEHGWKGTLVGGKRWIMMMPKTVVNGMTLLITTKIVLRLKEFYTINSAVDPFLAETTIRRHLIPS